MVYQTRSQGRQDFNFTLNAMNAVKMCIQEDGDDEGKVGLYSNAMAAQAIKPKKAAGRSQCTRRFL